MHARKQGTCMLRLVNGGHINTERKTDQREGTCMLQLVNGGHINTERRSEQTQTQNAGTRMLRLRNGGHPNKYISRICRYTTVLERSRIHKANRNPGIPWFAVSCCRTDESGDLYLCNLI
eukprot:1394876-Karenia_brevis.AAC.1